MIKLVRKEFSDKKKGKKKELSTATKKIGGVISVGAGAKILDDVHKSGEISGRVHLYHGTSREGGEKILKEGLKGSHALDEGNITNRALGGAGKKDGRKLVYTAKKRIIGLGHELTHLIDGKGGKLIKMSIPYDEYKKMKRVYDNPEFGGAKNVDEYVNLVKEGKQPNPTDRYIYESRGKKGLKTKYDNLSGAKGTKGTRIFEQDIAPERIKGSKKYVKNSLKEVGKYIKNNPKRFAKGLSKGTLGTGLVAGGAYLIGSKNKKHNNK